MNNYQCTKSVTHDPVFSHFKKWTGLLPNDRTVNFLGITERKSFLAIPYDKSCITEKYVNTDYPAFNESYFEWISLLEIILANRSKRFVMLELGAGFGRWLAIAAGAVRQLNHGIIKAPGLIAVEAEPTHHAWIKIHFQDNNIEYNPADIIRAAATENDDKVTFLAGAPDIWWGQEIARGNLCKLNNFADQPIKPITAPGISLNTLLQNIPHVDFIDIDVQGEEYKVLSTAVDSLRRKVKRIFVGTHSESNEHKLRELFSQTPGWKNRFDFKCKQVNSSAFGDIEFEDGIQVWDNPHIKLDV